MSARITSSIVWTHSFGQMRIETREDGSVWVDGRVVRDTAPGMAEADLSVSAPDASSLPNAEPSTGSSADTTGETP
jgi:hypothetical protein